MTEWLDSLNPEQREAVVHFEGPLLVLAGAGSGKTRVLTTRIVHLIHEHGVDARSILAVTFTNKAAAEMRARVRRLLGQEPAGMWIGTFHSIGARLLRRHAEPLGWSPSFTIYDGDNSLAEVKRTMDRLKISQKQWHPKAMRAAISDAKNRLIDEAEYDRLAADAFSRAVARVYPAYQAALKEQNAFDFDDLLVKPVELFRDVPALLDRYRRRFSFLLVDEYQDTNHAQYRLIEMLSGPEATVAGANLMVVGDDDQSIYGWRGADVSNILDFESRFPGTRLIRLERNYRSTQRILDAANRVIAVNIRRKGKTLRTDAEEGERLTILEAADERDEAEWIASEIERRSGEDGALSPRDFVILYRTNAQSRELERSLVERSLPYRIVGGTRFYERREIMDVLAYLRLISNPRDAQAFERIVNYPRRGIGQVSLTRLLDWARDQGLAPLEAAARAGEAGGVPTAAAAALERFAATIAAFRRRSEVQGAGELAEQLVADMGIFVALAEEGPEGEDRAANVRELIAGAYEFDERLPTLREVHELPEDAPSLDLFLQEVSLITDVDRHDPDANAVTLMTLHTAKGLEFPVVFISGLEEGLFPLARSFDEPAELEEERRLFYVGITRAERKVYLTHSRTRRRMGEVKVGIPSSFMEPLGSGLADPVRTPQVERQRRQYEGWRDRRPAAGRRTVRRGGYAEVEGADPGGYVIDYSDSQDAPRFIKGEVVRHPQFGRGTIRELSGLGPDLKAVIDFDGVGRKKVVVRYANLQKEP
ncbi:MAG TPA: UvrD-helicase domain-containing protein [Longimicrobiales bacterium]|nr:UvrD-helicase domain-containing protein [Longimicrobiales bacterium]